MQHYTSLKKTTVATVIGLLTYGALSITNTVYANNTTAAHVLNNNTPDEQAKKNDSTTATQVPATATTSTTPVKNDEVSAKQLQNTENSAQLKKNEPTTTQVQNNTPAAVLLPNNATTAPTLSAMSDTELQILIDKANKGDELAQNEVVKRYQWDSFSDTLLNKVDITSWANIEGKAKQDYQYAYMLVKRNQIKKYPQLARFIKEKAFKGDAAYQNIYGMLLIDPAFPDSLAAGFEWFKKSSDQGFAPAQLNQAYQLEMGLGTVKDDQQAFSLTKKAAEQGYVVAQYRLGLMYFQGIGVKEDIAAATDWIKKSANQGYPKAISFVQFLEAGGPAQSKSSLEFTMGAAEKGNALAQKMMGDKYQNGMGVGKDGSKAVEWWSKAADQGNEEAMLDLGHYYIAKGDSPTKAFGYFQKAADAGNGAGQAGLGYMYYKGIGTSKDEKKGLEILHTAANNGSVQAQNILDLLHK